MNVLWDFRLFSYGYGNRGIGNYCRAMANAILQENFHHKLFIWGDKSKISGINFTNNVTWIPYSHGNWKKDLLTIPLLSLNNKIDIFHYWVALGPLYHLGMGLFNPCKTVAAIYDMGTELWDIPYCKATRNSMYWNTQKKLIENIDYLTFVSDSTRKDFFNVFKQSHFENDVLYMPIHKEVHDYPVNRDSYLITLGGSSHKNLARTLKAFSSVNTVYPNFKLVVLGKINKEEECIDSIPENVFFEPDTTRYKDYLRSSSGLISCSIYEGLGIPPLEAMSFGCPILVSDIKSHNETCHSFAKKADPFNTESIQNGILDIINNNHYWAKCSQKGFERYTNLCNSTAKKCISIYESFTKN